MRRMIWTGTNLSNKRKTDWFYLCVIVNRLFNILIFSKQKRKKRIRLSLSDNCVVSLWCAGASAADHYWRNCSMTSLRWVRLQTMTSATVCMLEVPSPGYERIVPEVGTCYWCCCRARYQLKLNHRLLRYYSKCLLVLLACAAPADVDCAAKAIWPTPDTISNPACNYSWHNN